MEREFVDPREAFSDEEREAYEAEMNEYIDNEEPLEVGADWKWCEPAMED